MYRRKPYVTPQGDITQWLQERTALIKLARQMREQKVTIMPLEIKGLKGSAMMMKANIEALQRAYRDFNAVAPMHTSDVQAITTQVKGMAGDLEFAVNTLGNSTENSEQK